MYTASSNLKFRENSFAKIAKYSEANLKENIDLLTAAPVLEASDPRRNGNLADVVGKHSVPPAPDGLLSRGGADIDARLFTLEPAEGGASKWTVLLPLIPWRRRAEFIREPRLPVLAVAPVGRSSSSE